MWLKVKNLQENKTKVRERLQAIKIRYGFLLNNFSFLHPFHVKLHKNLL